MTNQSEYIIEATKRNLFDWKELWSYKELFYFFTWRDVKVKYKQTALGIIWVVLQPLLMVGIFSLFFSHALNIAPTKTPYPVFAFSGLLLWNFFSSSINAAGSSMLTNATIIKKIYFPRIIIPVSSILVSFIDFAVAFIVFLFVLIYFQIQIDFIGLLILWPLAICLMFLGTLGISCWLSALTVKYRDFRHVIPFGLQLALFVSPVIYPTSIVGSGSVSYFLAANPMYAPITLFRAPFMPNSTDGMLLLISILSTFVFLIIGILYFKKTEAYFADIA